MPLISRIVVGNFNGGTITNPLTVNLTGGAPDEMGLHLILPSDFDFSERAWLFEIGNDASNRLFEYTTGGQVGTGGNQFVTENASASTGTGSLTTQGDFQARTPGNVPIIATEGSGNKISFFDAVAVTQPTGVAVTAAGIHAALVSLGLITA